MGYDFALDDTATFRQLEHLDSRRCYMTNRNTDGEGSSKEQIKEACEEGIACHRERYEDVNLRREGMGMEPISKEELQSLEQDYVDGCLRSTKVLVTSSPCSRGHGLPGWLAGYRDSLYCAR